MAGKLIIIAAPSGSGKTSIVKNLLDRKLNLSFSVSATTRNKRPNETHGVDYFFISEEDFKKKIADNQFLEWEEVYTDKYYGTLKSEVSRINNKNHIVVFDVDVAGGCNIKKMYGANAMSIFIMPPSIATLKERLIKRGTDTMDVINDRVNKASYEMTFSDKFDRIVVNDDLEQTKALITKMVKEFMEE